MDKKNGTMKATRPARIDHSAYVRKVQKNTRIFAQDLIGEVERLRVQVAALESEKATLAAQGRGIETMAGVNDALRAQIEGIREEARSHSLRYAAVEQQHSNLANLYLASYRLHGTLDGSEVIAAVGEIIANLVGSEEAALFEIDPDTKTLELVAAFGVDPDHCPSVPEGSGLIGLTARTGEILVVDADQFSGAIGLESRLTACVPLKLDDRVTGVIAIFGLRARKEGIDDFDREVFDLLATQAAFALYCTALHAKVALEVARRW